MTPRNGLETPLARELSVAISAARRAGRAALEHYGSASAEMKAGSSPVTAADHASNEVILAALREAFPEDAILSEESTDSGARLAASRVWIIDPLDGTKEFLAQNGEFSVMIGLKNFRAGIEGLISFLKRAFGLDRCTWRGLEGFGRYVQASVLSANLLTLARHLLL